MKNRYENAQTFREFLKTVEAHRDLWHRLFERAHVPSEALERAESLPGRWHLLILVEDWCGDALGTLPYLARLTEASPKLDMRLLSRDENPDLMDAHLSGTNRSIPVVMVLDDDFREVAWWGSRPEALQDHFLAELAGLPREERFSGLRAWYARDRGRTALLEILDRIPVPV